VPAGPAAGQSRSSAFSAAAAPATTSSGPEYNFSIGEHPSAVTSLIGSTRSRADFGGDESVSLGVPPPLAVSPAVPSTAPASVGVAVAPTSGLPPLLLGPQPDIAASRALAAADGTLQPRRYGSVTASCAGMLSAGEPSSPAGARRGRGARGGRAAAHTAPGRKRRTTRLAMMTTPIVAPASGIEL